MAFNLNKSSEEKTKSKFNLSKSSETVPEVGLPGGTPPGNQPTKGKSSRLLLFLILGIGCLAVVIWFITNNSKSTDQKDTGMEQVSTNNQTNPNDGISSNSEGNVVTPANAIADSSQKAAISETPSSTEAQSVQGENVGSTSPANQVQVTNENNAVKGVEKSSAQENANIPYKKNESYLVYLFPFGEYDYAQANPELDKLADVLRLNPAMKISIFAYTDDIGDAAINMTISIMRANSIHKYLVNKGIDADRMKFQGKGISTKYATKAENRRVEFVMS